MNWNSLTDEQQNSMIDYYLGMTTPEEWVKEITEGLKGSGNVTFERQTVGVWFDELPEMKRYQLVEMFSPTPISR